MVEYIPCYSAPALHWGLLPASMLASRNILIEQNIKKRTGPAFFVLCGSHRPSVFMYTTRGTGLGPEHMLRTDPARCQPQSTQNAGPVRFLIFCSVSISLQASLVAGRRPQYYAGAD
jgi:hypothetical protein